MAKCVRLQRQDTRVCAGSLNRKIEIYETAITSPLDPAFNEVDYGEQFTLIARPWAMIEDINGDVIFDGVSPVDTPTVRFFIRYRQGITSENWVIYDNERYRILNVLDLDKNKRFLSLECTIRGDENKDATLA